MLKHCTHMHMGLKFVIHEKFFKQRSPVLDLPAQVIKLRSKSESPENRYEYNFCLTVCKYLKLIYLAVQQTLKLKCQISPPLFEIRLIYLPIFAIFNVSISLYFSVVYLDRCIMFIYWSLNINICNIDTPQEFRSLLRTTVQFNISTKFVKQISKMCN